MASKVHELERGVNLKKPCSPTSSPSSPSSSFPLFYVSTSTSTSLSSSFNSRPHDNTHEWIKETSYKTPNKRQLAASENVQSASKQQKHPFLGKLSSSLNLTDSFKKSQEHISKKPFLSPLSNSLQSQHSLCSKENKSSFSDHLDLSPTSPSILRKPSQKNSPTNKTICKKVKFQRHTSDTDVVSKKKSSKVDSKRFSNQYSSKTSSHSDNFKATKAILEESKTKTGTTQLKHSSGQQPSLFKKQKSSSSSFCNSLKNVSPSFKSTSLQQKSSWDESLEELSNGLRSICGSPDVFSANTFKRASSLSADFRRKTTGSNTLRASTSSKDCHQSDSSSGRRPLLSCSGTSLKRIPSHSPTLLLACQDEELYGLVTMPDGNNTHPTLNPINILDLIENSQEKEEDCNENAINNVNQPLCQPKIIANDLFVSNHIQKKKVLMRKQQSLSTMKTDTYNKLNSISSLKNAKKLTVRHDESFQSLQTELCRLLSVNPNDNIQNNKSRRCNDTLNEMFYNENHFENNKTIRSVLYDETEKDGNKKVRRNTDSVECIADFGVWEGVWKEKDEMSFFKEDYSTFCKIPLPDCGWSIEDLYVEFVEFKTIVVGFIKILKNSVKEKNETETKYVKEIIQSIENVDKMPCDLICTLSNDSKSLSLKVKNNKMQLEQENNKKSCDVTQPFNNDKYFVSFAECLSAVYLPILIQRSSHNAIYLSIYIKLPDEFEYDSISVKRIDESVLISATQSAFKPLNNVFFSEFMKDGTYVDDKIPEKTSHAYIDYENNKFSSSQQGKHSTQTNSMSCSNKELQNQFTQDGPKKTYQLPTNHSTHEYNSPIKKPCQKQQSSRLTKFPTQCPSPQFFASFQLPSEADLRSTTAYLSHHHILFIHLPLYNHLSHRRFSF